MTTLEFPLNEKNVSWDTTFSQQWDVTEQKTASGRRRTLCQQVLPAYTIGITYPMLTKAEKDTLLGFYAQCKGRWQSFWYKDAESRLEGVTLEKGADNKYQCLIAYNGFTEPAEKVSNVKVYVNGIETKNFTESNGKIDVSGSGTVTADYDYYWKVCFNGSLSITQKFEDLYSVSLAFEVVRE